MMKMVKMNRMNLRKLNKYQIGIIISLLIFSVSVLGFTFNTNVRLGKPSDNVPDIVIDEQEDIDDTDSEMSNETLFIIIMGLPLVFLMYKFIGEMWDD